MIDDFLSPMEDVIDSFSNQLLKNESLGVFPY